MKLRNVYFMSGEASNEIYFCSRGTCHFHDQKQNDFSCHKSSGRDVNLTFCQGMFDAQF